MSWTVNLDRRFAQNEDVRVSFTRNHRGELVEPFVTPRRDDLTPEQCAALALEATDAFIAKAKQAGRWPEF